MPRAPRTAALAVPLALLAAPVMAQLALESQVPGLQIVALDALPPAPALQGDRDRCLHKLVDAPTTPGGEVAHFQGWGVTAEVPLGALTAVSFVGRFSAGTSGSCELNDGNLGLFDGDRLVALVYADDADATRIGFAVPFGTDGLRLWSGDYLAAPLADLRPAGAGGLAVTPLAAREPVCGGAAEVPLIYGMPIDLARRLLMDAGWRPVPGAQDSLSFTVADLAAAGVPEVQDCAGTGFGFCAFAYDGPAGTLSVTTVGEVGADGSLPAVVDYGADCN